MRAGKRGFTYIWLLILVALMGGALAAAGSLSQTNMKREKERELLFIGDQFRRAIGQYYLRTPGAAKVFPRSLEDLLYDRRSPMPERYLRRIYLDPMTGSANWGLIHGSGGVIIGVHSQSRDKPLKQLAFKPRDAGFANKEHYADWAFVYMPPSAAVPNPATPPLSGTSAAKP